MINKLLIIGDVHGKTNEYEEIIKNTNLHSIQLGDFGFKEEHEWFLNNIDCDKHKINFGNHDDTSFIKENYSTNNFSINNNIMTVRGAYSIDQYFRTKNVDWWSDEELNYQEMQYAIDLYHLHKPKIMITHDCPQTIREQLFNIYDKSITSNGLQIMFEIHQPKIWLFGHHHKSINTNINGTQFICLKELETYIINTNQ